MIDLGKSWNDAGEPEELFLDTSSRGTWVLWRQAPGALSREQVWSLPPQEAFADLQERFCDFYFTEWEELGIAKCVAHHDWDSGAPGAGAGQDCVYQVGDVYYVTHDAGMDGPYASKQEAIERNGISEVADATLRIVGVEDTADE